MPASSLYINAWQPARAAGWRPSASRRLLFGCQGYIDVEREIYCGERYIDVCIYIYM